MRVGHAVVRLTITPGEPLGGYAEERAATDPLDPIELHVVTLAAGAHRHALVAADLVAVNVDLVADVRAALAPLGVTTAWIAATHTHSAPDAGVNPGGTATPAAVGARVVSGAVEAARRAITAEEEARLEHRRAEVAGVASRRTVPHLSGEVIGLDGLVVRYPDGGCGILSITPVHPTILGPENLAPSADLAGGVRRALRRGGDVRWAVALTGAAGDMSTRHLRRGRDLAEIDRVGGLVARALLDAPPEPIDAAGGLDVRPVRIPLPGKREPTTGRDLAPAGTTAASDDAGGPARRLAEVHRQGIVIERAYLAGDRPATLPCEAEILRVGRLDLIALPVELFSALGDRLRTRRGGRAALVVGYANGYLGYLPDRAAPLGYEVLVSPFSRGAGERLVAGLLAAGARPLPSRE